jgi:branched-chain amino acid transport system substrate-binding protein
MPYLLLSICIVISSVLQSAGQSIDQRKIDETPVSVFDKPVDFSGWNGDIQDSEMFHEIRIGIFLPNENKNPVSCPVLNAAELAIDEFNASGGYHGIPYRLVKRWAYEPWGAGSKEMIKLVYQDSVWAVIGSLDGNTTHIAEQIVTKAWLPLLSPVSSDPTLTYIRIPWMFRLSPDYKSQAEVIVNRGVRVQSLKKVGLITDADHDGRIFAKEIFSALKADHDNPPFHFEIPVSNRDFNEITQRATTFGADGIIIYLQQGDIIKLLSQLQKIDHSISVFLPWIPGMNVENLSQFYDGAIYFVEPFLRSDSPVYASFNQNYLQRYGILPPPSAAYSYDAVQLLVRSLNESGLNRSRLRDAIAQIGNYYGVTGKIFWDNGGGNRALPILRSPSGK